MPIKVAFIGGTTPKSTGKRTFEAGADSGGPGRDLLTSYFNAVQETSNLLQVIYVYMFIIDRYNAAVSIHLYS